MFTRTLLNRMIAAQLEGMGDVGSARYEPALLHPWPTTMVVSTVTVRDPPTLFLSEFSGI